MSTIALSPAEELERAMSDYLSISRGRHLYASTADHQAAEEKAWQRLEAAQAASASSPSEA